VSESQDFRGSEPFQGFGRRGAAEYSLNGDGTLQLTVANLKGDGEGAGIVIAKLIGFTAAAGFVTLWGYAVVYVVAAIEHGASPY
jgi:hypothetical protein